MNNSTSKYKMLNNVGMGLLAEGKTIRIKANGYSMYPSIKPGSIILIEPLNARRPVPGEIIAIERERGLIVHRLVKITDVKGVQYFTARGDSNAFADDPVKIDKIAGRIIRADISGENTDLADLRINTGPNYFMNRIRVIFIILLKKVKKFIR